MKYCYITLICILNVFLSSCSKSLIINGTYSDKHDHKFIFSSDSTFKYIYRGIWHKESSGTWTKEGNDIYLNSIAQLEKLPIEYKKTKDSTQNAFVNINIANVPDKTQRDYICFPYINGQQIFIYPERGTYSFESEIPIDSIFFVISKRPFILRGVGSKMAYDDIKTETIYPHLPIGENLDITINIIDSLFGYRVFKNEKLEVKNGSIVFRDKNKKYKLFLYGNLIVNSFATQKNIINLNSPDYNVDTIYLDKTSIEQYRDAYQYIIADLDSLYKHTSICFNDRTIGSNYVFFIDKLKNNGYLKDSSEVSDLYKLDSISSSKFIYLDEVFQNEIENKCVYILSFSDIIKNDLFAEIKMKKWVNTPFGESIIYFFRFNPDGTFKFIYRIELSGL